MTGAPAQGQLVFVVEDEFGRPMEAALHLLLGETVASQGRQYRISTRPGAAEIGGVFPAGSYTAQLYAKGYGVVRETVRLEPSQSLRCILRLHRRSFVKPSRAERLALYGVSPDRLGPLTVRSGERVVLDRTIFRDAQHVALLQPASVRDLKAWIGAPDTAFAGAAPRYGELPADADLDALTAEFLHGNSRAVGDFRTEIEARLRGPTGALDPVPIFLFDDVVIEDCGVLEIGSGSSILFCNTLTMHPQGVVRAIGDVRADIGICIQL